PRPQTLELGPSGPHVRRRPACQPPLSARAFGLMVGGRSPGFRAATRPRLPGTRCVPVALRVYTRVRRASPVTVAGPRRTFTGFPGPPTRYVSGHPILVNVTVNLTRIYTKLGDGGETHLGDMR